MAGNVPHTEEITLYLSSTNTVYHISYTIRPSSSSSAATVISVIPYGSVPTGPDPVLLAPVVPTPDGQPPAEQVEKTFLQKYWVYFLPIMLILLTSGGGGGGGEQRRE